MRHSSFRLSRFLQILSGRQCLAGAVCAGMGLLAGNARAQLAPNQTEGFGNGRLITFTYLQNFDCVDQPLLDLDLYGMMA